jgi:hypothetical protein
VRSKARFVASRMLVLQAIDINQAQPLASRKAGLAHVRVTLHFGNRQVHLVHVGPGAVLEFDTKYN